MPSLPPKLLAINSSPKTKKGHTTHLLDIFVESAIKLGAKVEIINLYKEHIRPFSGELNKKIKKFSKIQKSILASDGFVIATPTYWFNEPGVLKDFIDNLTPLEENDFMLEGKVAGFIVFSPQGGETEVLENLAMTFNQMGVLLPPYSLIFNRGVKEDNWAFADSKLLAKRMITAIEAQKQLKLKWR